MSGSPSVAFRVSPSLCFSGILVNHGIVPSYPGRHSLQTNFGAHVTTENRTWVLKPFQEDVFWEQTESRLKACLDHRQVIWTTHLPVRALSTLTGLNGPDQPRLHLLSHPLRMCLGVSLHLRPVPSVLVWSTLQKCQSPPVHGLVLSMDLLIWSPTLALSFHLDVRAVYYSHYRSAWQSLDYVWPRLPSPDLILILTYRLTLWLGLGPASLPQTCLMI